MLTGETTAASGAAAPPRRLGRAHGLAGRGSWRWLRPHPGGVLAGTAFAMLAMTPSLLPRDWLFQGLVSGLSAAAGYGFGVLLAWLLRRWWRWRDLLGRLSAGSPVWAPALAWSLLLVAVPVGLTTMLVVGAGWQRDIADLMGMERTTTSGWLRAGPLLVLVFAAVLAVARAVRWCSRLVGRLLRRWVRLPARLATVVAAVLVGFVVVTLVNDVLLQRALSAADTAFSVANTQSYPGVQQPTSANRSGSPDSLVPWATLGREGRRFVATGPGPERLGAVVDRPVLDPIRVYVGLETAETPLERVDLAVAELERTGAFEREVLLVATTTGRGWVNPSAVDSLEVMYGGDTAIVATQYSYLPSWLSFLVDRTRARDAGRLLFDAVSAQVKLMPEAQRPELLVYGESLGSQGSEHAFSTLADIRAEADGVLWVGPPNSNTLWSSLVARRDPGTTEVEPEYAGGLVVRFAGSAEDLEERRHPWQEPRVLYLQHSSDPIVWWSPDLLFGRPGWLVEPRGDDVSPAMSWYPVVTFWQVSADLTNALSVPEGHGHNYDDEILDGWVAVAAPAGWTDADTDAVRAALAP